MRRVTPSQGADCQWPPRQADAVCSFRCGHRLCPIGPKPWGRLRDVQPCSSAANKPVSTGRFVCFMSSRQIKGELWPAWSRYGSGVAPLSASWGRLVLLLIIHQRVVFSSRIQVGQAMLIKHVCAKRPVEAFDQDDALLQNRADVASTLEMPL